MQGRGAEQPEGDSTNYFFVTGRLNNIRFNIRGPQNNLNGFRLNLGYPQQSLFLNAVSFPLLRQMSTISINENSNVVEEHPLHQNLPQNSISETRRDVVPMPFSSATTTNGQHRFLEQHRPTTTEHGNPLPSSSSTLAPSTYRRGLNGIVEIIPEELDMPIPERRNVPGISLIDFAVNYCGLGDSTESQSGENNTEEESPMATD